MQVESAGFGLFTGRLKNGTNELKLLATDVARIYFAGHFFCFAPYKQMLAKTGDFEQALRTASRPRTPPPAKSPTSAKQWGTAACCSPCPAAQTPAWWRNCLS